MLLAGDTRFLASWQAWWQGGAQRIQQNLRWAGRKAERMSYLPTWWNQLLSLAVGGWSGPSPPPVGTIHDWPWNQVGARVVGGSRRTRKIDVVVVGHLSSSPPWGTGIAATVRIMLRASARPRLLLAGGATGRLLDLFVTDRPDRR